MIDRISKEEKEAVKLAECGEYTPPSKKLFLVKDLKMIEFLKESVQAVADADMNPGIVDDYFIQESYFVNNFMFYTSIHGDFWATTEDLVTITNELFNKLPVKSN